MHTIKILQAEDSQNIYNIITENKLNWSYTNLLDSLTKTNYFAVGIEKDNIIVGFAIYNIIAPEASLELIGIKPKYQKNGYGKILICETEKELLKRNISVIFLEVSEKNKAYHFYESRGFELIGKRKSYYTDGSDALLMKKSL